MYSTKGIEAVATITELRSKTSELVEHAKNIERGILIQKNNEPYAVLISYDLYLKLLGEQAEPVQTTTRRRRGRKKKRRPTVARRSNNQRICSSCLSVSTRATMASRSIVRRDSGSRVRLVHSSAATSVCSSISRG